jgi:tetratricopeptide (TPR) repeat protein
MHRHDARSRLLPLLLIAILPALRLDSSAQTNNVPSAKPNPSTTANLQAADEAFRAGSAAYQRNDLPTAHAQFARLVHLAPNVATGHTAYGTVLLAEGNARAAAAELEQARKLDPHDTNAALNLALAYTQLRAYSNAIEVFRLLEQPNRPFPQDAAIAYATALAATSQFAAAQGVLERALNSQPDSPVLHDSLGTILAQREQYDDAAS